MDTEKETFLRNEFLTMSIFGALGRSNTYSKSASETSKNLGHLPGCGELNWTSIDSNEDYLHLVRAAENIAQSKTLSEWELKVWGKSSPIAVRPPRTMVKRNAVDKSPGFEKFASKFHDQLKMVMIPYKNNVLKTAKIKNIIESVPTLKGQEQWIYPSDHCINHTNKGACDCAKTENALFFQIARGKYRVL